MVFTLVFYSLNFVVDPRWAKRGPNWPELRRRVTAALVVLVAPFGIASAFRGGFACTVGIVLGLATTVVFGVYYDVMTRQDHDFDRDRYFDR
jgi:multisubunit Na+/H+ antiporter MnhB subunit